MNGLQFQSESIVNLAKALVEFQKQVKPVEKAHTNPHFKSRYADLNDCWQAARAPLASSGLSVVQQPTATDSGGCVLITTLLHTSGEFMKATYPVHAATANPQSLASALTYAKRNSFCAMLGLTGTGEDDDGNDAAEKPAQPAANRLPNTGHSPTGSGPAKPPAPQSSANGQPKPNGQQKRNPKAVADKIIKNIDERADDDALRRFWLHPDVVADMNWLAANAKAEAQRCVDAKEARKAWFARTVEPAGDNYNPNEIPF